MTSQWVSPVSGEKLCSRCERWLPTSEFRPNPRLSSGLHSWCRECCLERTRQWRAEHREEDNARQRARYHAARAARTDAGV